MPNEENNEVEEVDAELYAPFGENTYTKKEVEPEYVTYKDVKLEYSKKPFNTKKLVYIIFIILIFLLFGIASYSYLKNKKNVYRNWLNSETKIIEEKIIDISSSKFFSLSKTVPFTSTAILGFSTTYDNTLAPLSEQKFLDTLNNTNISASLAIDYKAKEFSYSLKSTYNNDNLFSIYGNGSEDTLSFLIRDIIGKYITVPNNFKFLVTKDSKEEKKDIEKLRKFIINILLQDIKQDDFEENKTTILIDSKEEEVKDISLNLDENTILNRINTLCSSIKNSKKLKEKLLDYFNIDENDLDNIIKKVESSSIKNINIHLYTKGITNKIVKYEISITDKDTYTFSKTNTEYSLYKNETSIFDIKIGDKITGTIFDNKIEISDYLSDTINYSIIMKDETYKGIIKISDSELTLSKQGNIELTIKHLNDKEEISSLKSTLTFSSKTSNSIFKYDDEKQVDLVDLKEEEKLEIKNRVKNYENVKVFKNNIKSYLTELKNK
jgi:hypothetical protein